MKRILIILLALLAAALVCQVGTRAEAEELPSAVTFTFFGDANSTTSDTPPSRVGYVMTSMKACVPAFAVTSGDAIRDTTDDAVATALSKWTEYLAVEAGFGLPVYRTVGDNDRVDLADRLTAYTQTFGLPLNYTKDVNGIHFIFLDSTSAGHIGYLGDAQVAWLEGDLAAQPQPSTIVVVTHYPFFSGKTNKPYATTQTTEATAVGTVFTQYGVDLVLEGDTHVYRRTVVGGVNYLQTAPCGSTPRTIGVSPIPPLASGEHGQSGQYGYELVVVNADRSLTLRRCTVSSTGGTYVGNAVTVADVQATATLASPTP